MLVRATATGYANSHQKMKGDIFVIADKLFSSKWMEKIEESPKVEPKSIGQKIKDKLGGK